MKNELKEIFRIYRRYIIILLVILGFVIFNLFKAEANALYKEYKLDNFKDANVVIQSGKVEYLLPTNGMSSESYYSFSFMAKCRPENDDQIPLNTANDDDEIEKTDSKVVVYAKNDFGETTALKEITVKNSDVYERFTASLKSDGDYGKIYLAKISETDTNMIFLKDFRFTRLNMTDDTQFGQLKPTVFGKTDQESVEPAMDSYDDRLFETKYKDGVIGQFFQAKTPYLNGVALRFFKKGNGGKGSYFARIYEAQKNSDDTFTITQEIFAKYEFHSFDPVSYLNQFQEARLPLVTFLTPGQYYFIGLDASMAETDSINYLEIQGSTDQDRYADGYAAFYQNGQLQKIDGDLFFKVFNKEYEIAGGEKVLSGAVIEQTGAKSGMYSFNTKSNITDYLDLDQDSLVGNKVYFDFKTNAVLGVVEEGNNFVYKINALSPIKKVAVSYLQLGDKYYNSILYYSYDKVNWERIIPENSNPAVAKAKEGRAVFKASGAGQIYIKVSYDPNDKNKEQGLFGLKSLVVLCELNG